MTDSLFVVHYLGDFGDQVDGHGVGLYEHPLGGVIGLYRNLAMLSKLSKLKHTTFYKFMLTATLRKVLLFHGMKFPDGMRCN